MYGHIIRYDNLRKTILQGMVEGNRKCGRPKRKWIDDIKEWSKLKQSELMVKPHDHNEWRRHCITASSLISPTIRESREQIKSKVSDTYYIVCFVILLVCFVINVF